MVWIEPTLLTRLLTNANSWSNKIVPTISTEHIFFFFFAVECCKYGGSQDDSYSGESL